MRPQQDKIISLHLNYTFNMRDLRRDISILCEMARFIPGKQDSCHTADTSVANIPSGKVDVDVDDCLNLALLTFFRWSSA